jgi:hypothetical protein
VDISVAVKCFLGKHHLRRLLRNITPFLESCVPQFGDSGGASRVHRPESCRDYQYCWCMDSFRTLIDLRDRSQLAH